MHRFQKYKSILIHFADVIIDFHTHPHTQTLPYPHPPPLPASGCAYGAISLGGLEKWAGGGNGAWGRGGHQGLEEILSLGYVRHYILSISRLIKEYLNQLRNFVLTGGYSWPREGGEVFSWFATKYTAFYYNSFPNPSLIFPHIQNSKFFRSFTDKYKM